MAATDMATWTLVLSVLDSAVRLSVPLIFACLAGLYSERAGVVDIGLEGKLLAGAFAAGATTAVIPDPWIGLVAAVGHYKDFLREHGFLSADFTIADWVDAGPLAASLERAA